MRKLSVFNNVSLDGYFTDAKNDMSFAHNTVPDPEWQAFVQGNAGGGGVLVFGRITYEMMAAFWPTPAAAAQMPEVAAGMNGMQKIVFSRTLTKADWANTTLVKGDLVAEIRRLKEQAGPGMAILGSGTIVAQLTPHRLIDEYQFAVVPVVLGKGRTMFDGMRERVQMRMVSSRSFKNGNVLATYVPAAG
jgi:dihydrofolate reductase